MNFNRTVPRYDSLFAFSLLFLNFFSLYVQDTQAESAPSCLPDFMARSYRSDCRIAFHFNIKNWVFSLNVRSFIHQTAVENPPDFSLPLNMSLARNKGRIRNHFDAVLFKMSFTLFDSSHLCKAHSNTDTDIYQEEFSNFMSLFSFSGKITIPNAPNM